MNTTTSNNSQDLEAFLGEDERPPFWKRPIVWIPALLIVLAAIAYAIFGGGEDGPQFNTEAVERRSLDLVVTATGNLRPTNQVEVGSEVSGRIDDVLVDVNDVVARGQVLARINTDVIDDQILQSRANLSAAHARVEQAQATLDVDTAQLERLREVYRLSDGRVPSAQEMQAAEGTVRRDEAALVSARADVASAEASLSTAQTNRDRALIRSPVSGVVLARQVEPGQTVAASFNTPTLFVLAEDLSVMQLRVKVDEADVGQVENGQSASFTVDAYPGRQFPAVVERVDLASSNIATAESTGSQQNSVVEYEARLTVQNSEGLLRAGMTATAAIATESTGEQLLVPNSAIRFRPPQQEDTGGVQVNNGNDFGLEREGPQTTIGVGSRQTVYIVGEDGQLQPINIVTGRSDGRLTVVTSEELEEGMQVVTSVRAQGNE